MGNPYRQLTIHILAMEHLQILTEVCGFSYPSHRQYLWCKTELDSDYRVNLKDGVEFCHISCNNILCVIGTPIAVTKHFSILLCKHSLRKSIWMANANVGPSSSRPLRHDL